MDQEPLDPLTVDPDPMRQFASWYAAGSATDVVDPNAMTLATATREGRPSARMVLLKSYDERGFVFFTNYESRKGQELLQNPFAALILYWNGLRRQIRIEGSVERIAPEESDEYFSTRPRGSRLAALASAQSSVLRDRETLERRVAEVSEELEGLEVERPVYWGGYRLCPTSIEFWQGRRDRLHDRVQYRRESDDTWAIERLSP